MKVATSFRISFALNDFDVAMIIALISKGLTALETWCLAMIGLVFITLIAYGIILVQLHQTLNERSWRLELCMFVTLVIITICFVLAFLIHCFANT